MRISRIAIAAGAALTAAGTLTAAVPAAAAPAPSMRRACPVVRPDTPRCLTLYAPQTAVNRALAEKAAGKRVPAALTTPKGVGASTIESAYKLPVTKGGTGQTVAIVDAFSTPHLASDLAVYRKQYGLPPCTTASGCLRIVNQQGKPSPLPRPDPTGWGVEETLDVSMVSAACPLCKIIVVEGTPADVRRPRRGRGHRRQHGRTGRLQLLRRQGGRVHPGGGEALHPPGSCDRRLVRGLRVHRGAVPGEPGQRDRGRWHQAGQVQARAGLEGNGLERQRRRLGQRLLGLRGQAELAA